MQRTRLDVLPGPGDYRVVQPKTSQSKNYRLAQKSGDQQRPFSVGRSMLIVEPLFGRQNKMPAESVYSQKNLRRPQ